MYITGFCSISPAGILTPQSHLQDVSAVTTSSSIEPDYKELIPVLQLRRMTKPVRLGIAAAKISLQSSGIRMPDSIHVGTAYGMLQDSETFLQKIIEQEEQMLPPTAFIQSTHNTVGGQIALMLGCTRHNMTFVHKGHSFESALLDARLMLSEPTTSQVLAGAAEECTDTGYAILKRFGLYDHATTAGEGASFFTLSRHQEPTALARIKELHMFRADHLSEVMEQLRLFFASRSPKIHPEDVLILGANGQMTTDPIYEALKDELFPQHTPLLFKQYCGEFPTASAFALSLGILKLKESPAKQCWIITHFNKHWSCYHIEKAG